MCLRLVDKPHILRTEGAKEGAIYVFHPQQEYAMGNRKRRLNLVIPERAMERLEWLRDRTDAASHTEVIRQALFVYEEIVERISDGSKLMEKTSKGELLPLAISVDVRRAPSVELRVAS